MMLRLTIPDIPPGPNGRRGLFRLHWAARRRLFESWAWLVTTALHRRPDAALKKRVSVSIHQVRRRALDRDNLYASCKPVLDALVTNRLIFDDSERWVELTATQEVGREVKTIITIG
jgi:hypothetical protein